MTNTPDSKNSKKQEMARPLPAVSEERVQGFLENIFGLKIPRTKPFETDEEQKYAGSLENVYGVKLPSDMVSRAYSIFIREYKR